VGTGYWFRNNHELLLVGTRGKIPAPAPGTQWNSCQDYEVGKHSEKPERFLVMIEEYFPNLPSRPGAPGMGCMGKRDTGSNFLGICGGGEGHSTSDRSGRIRVAAAEHKKLGGHRIMTGGRKSRQKGDRLERAIVRVLQERGFGAERVPLSGSAGGSYCGDISVPLLGRDLTVECKARKDGFRELYAWLDGRDALIVRADRKEPLVVVPMRLAVEIAAAAERRKGGAR